MKRSAAIAVIIIALTGCSQPEPDQDLRAKLFLSCMNSLPAGPTATMYNDWDEVVEECGRQAYFMSLRRKENQ